MELRLGSLLAPSEAGGWYRQAKAIGKAAYHSCVLASYVLKPQFAGRIVPKFLAVPDVAAKGLKTFVPSLPLNGGF